MVRSLREFKTVMCDRKRSTSPVGRYYQLMALQHYPAIIPGDRIIDFGCGNGEFFGMLHHRARDTMGIEINSRLHKKAIMNGRYTEVIASVEKGVKCDTIICNSVLEHISDLPEVLRVLHDSLSTKGTMYLTVPLKGWESLLLGTKIFGRRYGKEMNDLYQHVNMLNQNEWKRLLIESGFVCTKFASYMSEAAYFLADLLRMRENIAQHIMNELYGMWLADKDYCAKNNKKGGSLYIVACPR